MDNLIYKHKLNQKFRLPEWSVFTITILVSIATAVSIAQFNKWAETSGHTIVLLLKMEEQLSRLNSLEWEAIAKQEIDDNLQEELAENEEDTESLLNQIQQLNQPNKQFDNFFTLFNRYQTSVARAFQLIATKQVKQVLEINVEEIDNIYDELYLETELLRQIYIEQEQQARNIVNWGTTLSLLLAGLTVGGVFWRFNHELWTKNQDLAATLTELQQTQGQLIQTEKMAALGQLVAGVAHEINTPLGAIQASANNSTKALTEVLSQLSLLNQHLNLAQQECFFKLIAQALESKTILTSSEKRPLKKKLVKWLQDQEIERARNVADTLIDMGIYADGNGEQDCQYLSSFLPLLKHPQVNWILHFAYNLTRLSRNNCTIVTAVERASKVVFSLKNYARQEQAGEKQIVPIVEGIETVLEIYRNQIKRNIEIVRNYQYLPQICCYPDELIQVWTNLIHNAIQAITGRGEIEIATYQADKGFIVQITDSGCGIPPEVQAKIFEPFFTTKPMGEGSGLGLHICQKIIEKHQGSIKVESKPGQTKFSVWLPVNSER